jgi:uncharacterized protein YdeI (YjbR/CyaY-like superfamily)
VADERAGLPVIAFSDAGAFAAWIAAQPAGAPGLWVRFAKKSAGVPCVGKGAAIDVALCYGWIDGQLDTWDEHWFLTRFTPRKPRSRWSAVNVERAEALIAAGRMMAEGHAAIAAAKADGQWADAYQPASRIEVPADLQAALDANPDAAAFFATLTGAHRYAVLYRIGAVKRAETRARKIADYVAMLARGETIGG